MPPPGLEPQQPTLQRQYRLDTNLPPNDSLGNLASKAPQCKLVKARFRDTTMGQERPSWQALILILGSTAFVATILPEQRVP